MTKEEAIAYGKRVIDLGLNDETRAFCEMAIKALEREPNVGHWIDNHNNTISCDRCHTWFNKDDRYGYMHYCPNCGVKMQEVGE